MKELDSRLQDAFGSVHADETLKASARVYVRAKSRRYPVLRVFRPVTALACMLLVFFGGYFSRMYFEPVTVISIDINPSIELGVNAFEHVVRVEAFNEDGRHLADQLQLRFVNYQEAVDRIVSSDTVTALLNQEEELVISVVGEDMDRNQKLCSTLEYYTESDGSHCYHASLETVEQAHGCGMSYGKYLAYLDALQQDETLVPEDVQDMTMKEIQEITETTCETQPSQHNQKHNHNKHKNGHH